MARLEVRVFPGTSYIIFFFPRRRKGQGGRHKKEFKPFVWHEKVPVAQLVERVLWILSYDGNVRQYLLSTINGEVGSSSLPWCIIFFLDSKKKKKGIDHLFFYFSFKQTPVTWAGIIQCDDPFSLYPTHTISVTSYSYASPGVVYPS